MILWDDYRPIEYAQETVPVAAFLSLFQGQPLEVQVSQAFNDGNIDFEWRRGCIMTAKAKDLWKPCGTVSAEDVQHMQSRVLMFSCDVQVPKLKDTVPCARCMCRWMRDAAAAHDAQRVLQAPLLPVVTTDVARTGGSPLDQVTGMVALVDRARLPSEVASALAAELCNLGAVHVQELTSEDWKALPSFLRLRVFEQRRLLASLL